MEKFFLVVVFAYSSTCLFADVDLADVVFTENLTNDTSWVYSEMEFVKSGEMEITKANAFVLSQIFPMAITKVCVVAKKAGEPGTRNLVIVPIFADGSEGASCDITPSSLEYETHVCTFSAHLQVRGFKITSTAGRGNVFLNSATVSGVAMLEVPKALEVSQTYANRVTLSWISDESALSNKLEVTQTIDIPFSANYSNFYGFENLSNDKGNTRDIANDDELPGFEGMTLRVPAHSEGVLQIGTSLNAGFLVMPSQETYHDLNLVMNVKYADNNPPRGQMIVRYIAGSETNDLAEVEFVNDYSCATIPLQAVPDGARIALYSPLHNDKRFFVESLGFATEVSEAKRIETAVLSKIVKSNEYTVKGLEANTVYQWSVVSYGADGAMSRRSEIQSISTNDEIFPNPGFLIGVR